MRALPLYYSCFGPMAYNVSLCRISLYQMLKCFLLIFFFSSCTFRDSHWKMQRNWQLKEKWIFIQFMLPLFLHRIRVSHLRGYWTCRRSGEPVLYLRPLSKFLLEFSQLPITLQRGWLSGKLGCNQKQSSLHV